MIVLAILGIPCLAFIFTSVITPMLPEMFKRKPLTCESCLSFWGALIYFGHLGIISILIASICYVIASIIWKL